MTIWGVIAVVGFLGGMVAAGWALLTWPYSGPWSPVSRVVLGASSTTPGTAVAPGTRVVVRGTVGSGHGLLTPDSKRPCAWAHLAVDERVPARHHDDRPTSRPLVRQQSNAPVTVSGGGGTVVVAGDRLAVQLGQGDPPAGLVRELELAFSSVADDWDRWRGANPDADRADLSVRELVLDEGVEVELVGVSDGNGAIVPAPGLRKVLALRPGGAALAAERFARESRGRRQRLLVVGGLWGASFVGVVASFVVAMS